jgi:hypothetical protein
MSTTTIYRKTAKGSEAIANRQSGLGPRHRSLLIMTDGRRSVAELAPVGSAFGDVGELFAALLAQGLIEPVHEAAATPAAASVAAPSAPLGDPARQKVSLSQAQRHAVHLLNDLLGPSAAELCMKLEASKTVAEFRSSLQRTEAVLRDAVGPRKAEHFLHQMEQMRGV